MSWESEIAQTMLKLGESLQMRTILATEGEFAEFIGRQFQHLATSARSAAQDGKQAQCVRDAVRALPRPPFNDP